ncbi:acyl-CoA N-acyltransferase [Dendryphion nanum]|uniref:Histone acetyltransferase type B catalytic subunit n=1 Tax=Dendryphion nanum TaxID=256645 RepID=A0A9P9DES9_9PLEO|nr:acyl-CoA N-acyltransferase [Dendryphion nanum]
MEDLEDWIHEANDCVHINLTRPSDKAEPVFEDSFGPEFTYPILGDEQKIIGYRNPRISLHFRANDLKPNLDITFKEKIDLSTLLPDGAEQVDIEAAWESLIPSDDSESTKTSSLSENDPMSNSWKPPGEVAHTFESHGKKFEIWKSTLADPDSLKLWQNMQVLVLLFIEGASLLDIDEEWTLQRWTLYLLYEVTPIMDPSISPYTLAGFSTTHRYWIFPTFEVMRALKALPSPPASSNGESKYAPPKVPFDPDTSRFQEVDLLQEPSRERISQFVILPPFQGQSLGCKLYETIFGDLVKLPNIYEIPVEDPNETFDKMRDYADMDYLRRLPAFKNLTVATNVPPEKLRKDSPISRDQLLGNGTDLDALRIETKIVQRQFNRLVELHLLSTIPPLHRSKARITRKEKASNENDRKFYFWRLAVKERIYQQHAEVLSQIEESSERVEKVEAALENQLDEYIERLEGLEKRSSGTSSGGGLLTVPRPKRKRRTIVDDEEDDEWEDMEEGSVASSSKRVKS